jgi:hypothetical protein
MELTGKICDINPFCLSILSTGTGDSGCAVVLHCMDGPDQQHGVLAGDQMLWFGTQLPNSLLLNPNQMQAYGISVYDDPFDTSRTFGINSDQAFIPFDTTGTFVHFESHVPTEWAKTHLPIILLSSED